MLPDAMLTMALLLPNSPNPIQSAVDYYQQVDTYQATLKSSSGGQSNRQEIIRITIKNMAMCAWRWLHLH